MEGYIKIISGIIASIFLIINAESLGEYIGPYSNGLFKTTITNTTPAIFIKIMGWLFLIVSVLVLVGIL